VGLGMSELGDRMTADAQTIPRRRSHGPTRLSFPQERMFLLDQIMPGLGAYNVPTLVKVDAVLDAEKLGRAFGLIVARHEILRTKIRLLDGVPVQEVFDPRPFDLTVADLRSLPEAAREAEASRLLGDLAGRPFDLSGDVLLRAALAHMGSEDQLLVVLHHLGSDHVSASLLFAELDHCYQAICDGREPQLPSLPIQYADYAEWQRQQLSGELLDDLLGFWTDQLRDAPDRLDLPTDRPRPSAQTYRGSWHETTIAADLLAPVRRFARQESASMFMVLLAAFKTLLHRYTGAQDIVVGTPVSGRHYEEIESLLGFFSNTLALRTSLSGDPTFIELLARVKLTTLGALAHQELPFEKLVEALNPARTRSHSPLFQVLFGYDVVGSEPRALTGAPVERLRVPGWEWSRFDLSIVLHDLPDGSLRAQVGYSTDLFDHATVERALGHLTELLAGVGEDPGRPISRLPLLTEHEHRLMLGQWNATSTDFDRRCLHELFAEQAARVPHAVAVADRDERLTYRELDERANQLANELVALGVEPGTLVGVCLERSVNLVVALLGVLKSGGAYVPIDPTYPPQRQEFILADAAAPVLLTEEGVPRGSDPPSATVVFLDRDRKRIAAQSNEAPRVPADPERIAYQIYTSGSTGQPKGVMVAHSSVANLVSHMRRSPGLDEHDVVANLTTPAFDLSVPDWYLPLTTGARLAIVPPEATPDAIGLADWLTRTAATFVQATPTTWQMLVDGGWAGGASLKILCGGEALAPSLRNELASRGVSLWHAYGPTEATVWSSILELGRGEGPAPLGGPIANTSFYVLDPNRQLVPIGVPGELFIGGEGIALGYGNRPELTAEKFIENPFGPGRLYGTGDLVRWRDNGTLEFSGRIDHQVKLRGYRIELGEVEAVLCGHPEVGGAVAAVREIGPGDRRLVAYLLPRNDVQPDVEQVRRLVKTRLPPFMVPSAFVVLESFPVNANGKLDRAALPAPDGTRSQLLRSYAPPEAPVEHELASIWADVLSLDRVGIDDNFFDLGGHSLLAVRMLSRVRDALGVEIRLATLFERSTVRELADAVTAALFTEAGEDELAKLLDELEAAER
jgi:amino acid adenylation domain-containing protein